MTEVGSFAYPRLDVLPRPFASVRARSQRTKTGPADEPVSMLPLQTLRGVDMGDAMCTSDLFGGRGKMGKGINI
jgi:hypothetical protein